MTTSFTPASVLPHSQRLRFIRSIRKLGDLLTESSLLIDSPTSPTTIPSPPSFLDLPGSKSSTAVTPMRAFFSLRHPASPAASTFAVSATVSPNATLTSTQDKPTPLGPTPGQRAHRKRSSTVSVPEKTSTTSMTDSSPSSSLGRRTARRTRRAVRHTASSTFLRAPQDVFDAEPFSYPSLVPIPSSASSSESVSSVSSPDEADAENHLTTPRMRTTSTSTAMHRREAGWSGEWSGSVRDIEDVVRGLRGLRLK